MLGMTVQSSQKVQHFLCIRIYEVGEFSVCVISSHSGKPNTRSLEDIFWYVDHKTVLTEISVVFTFLIISGCRSYII